MSEPNQNNNAGTNTTSTRRRSSGLIPAFESLSQQRHAGGNAERRQSMSDQTAKPGFLGQLFHNNFGRNAGGK